MLAVLLGAGAAHAQSTSSTEPNRSEDTTTGRVVPSREGSKSSSTTVEQNRQAKERREKPQFAKPENARSGQQGSGTARRPPPDPEKR